MLDHRAVAEIERRVALVGMETWHVESFDVPIDEVEIRATDSTVTGIWGPMVHDGQVTLYSVPEIYAFDWDGGYMDGATARFIAQSKEDIRALLGDRRTLLRRIDALEAELAQMKRAATQARDEQQVS